MANITETDMQRIIARIMPEVRKEMRSEFPKIMACAEGISCVSLAIQALADVAQKGGIVVTPEGDQAIAPPDAVPIDSLELPELLEAAKSLDIDVTEGSTREQVIEAITDHVHAAEAADAPDLKLAPAADQGEQADVTAPTPGDEQIPPAPEGEAIPDPVVPDEPISEGAPDAEAGPTAPPVDEPPAKKKAEKKK